MNRNTYSRFSLAPQVSAPRSKFSRDCDLKTSFNVGDLVPIFVDEVLPGDEFQVRTSKVLRLQTLITPVMDNLWLDTYFFFVPNRLVWEHWVNLMGENSDSAWIPEVEYSVPEIEAPSGGWNIGTIADYMGIPVGVDNIAVNALPIRSYAKVCEDWFRDQNNSQPLNIPLTDSSVVGVNTGNYVTDVAKAGLPFKASKYHDYFTSALPAPLKGEAVTVPMASADPVSVYAQGVPNSHFYPGPDHMDEYASAVASSYPLMYEGYDVDVPSTGSIPYPKVLVGSQVASSDGYYVHNFHQIDGAGHLQGSPDKNHPYLNLDLTELHTAQGGSSGSFTPVNLVADSNAIYADINSLRLGFQIQRMLERDARGGSRYIELLRSHFSVSSPDARLQRSEYLGGNRVPFNVRQVTQTSSTDTVTPQGNVTGYSLTADVHFDFSKGFTEHGWIIGVAVARYEHSYPQGLEPFWSRRTRFDFYWPSLAHIGECPVYNRSIFAQGTDEDDEVFGYQEAWADYRYKPNRVTGEMRSDASLSLDSWHFADDYSSLPYLSDDWIREDKSNVDRALAVTSSTAHQIFADFYFDNKVTRCMPLYSIPGLIDHF